MRQHIVGDDEIGRSALAQQAFRKLAPEELGQRRHTPRLGRLRDVAGRLDAEDRDAAGHEVLEQVAVVAGELDDGARGPEPQPGSHRLGVSLGVVTQLCEYEEK